MTSTNPRGTFPFKQLEPNFKEREFKGALIRIVEALEHVSQLNKKKLNCFTNKAFDDGLTLEQAVALWFEGKKAPRTATPLDFKEGAVLVCKIEGWSFRLRHKEFDGAWDAGGKTAFEREASCYYLRE